jgi:hypothetical protein
LAGLTLLLDVIPSWPARRKDGGGEWNRMDAYELALHEVCATVTADGAAEPERW